MTTFDDFLAWMGTADVYLLDQLQRGRVRPPMRVLDAGCGAGRNAEPLLRAGFDVHAIDTSPAAVDAVRARAAALAPGLPPEHFRAARTEDLDPARDGTFDAVLSIAVLHFARDSAHFGAMVRALGGVLRRGGLLFARLATTITVEGRTTPLGDGRHRLGDGTERFLASAGDLRALTDEIGGELADPLRTVHVDGVRAMTTWVVRKR